jgi:uncharacterized protein
MMIKLKYCAHLLIFVLLFTVHSATAAIEVPFLRGRVTDDAELLSPDAVKRISAKLESHEKNTTNQVAVLTVATLDGESIEGFAVRVFEKWQLGQKNKDNGILVVVAPKERRMRIEVGYGLEGRLTDLEAGRIIRNIMAPRFKKNNFDDGIEQGVLAIIGQLEGKDEMPAGAEIKERSGGALDLDGPDLGILERILLGAFIFGIIGLFTVFGVLTPRTGWFLYFFLIPFWAMFPIVILGTRGAFILLVVYLIAFPVVKLILGRTPWYKKAAKDLKTKGRASIGGWTITSGGSSSGSWSSSGGGFSGGGGSSGGGGASGGW